jgi:hypothetical protein
VSVGDGGDSCTPLLLAAVGWQSHSARQLHALGAHGGRLTVTYSMESTVCVAVSTVGLVDAAAQAWIRETTRVEVIAPAAGDTTLCWIEKENDSDSMLAFDLHES